MTRRGAIARSCWADLASTLRAEGERGWTVQDAWALARDDASPEWRGPVVDDTTPTGTTETGDG